MWRNTCEEEEESGCLPHRDMPVSSSLEDMQQSFFQNEFSRLWPLIDNVALVLFLFFFVCFFLKTCLFCRVVFFKVA